MVRRSAVFALVASLCLAAWPAPEARAGVIITITQVGPDVDVSGSGTIDLAGLGSPTLIGGGAEVYPSLGVVLPGPPGTSGVDRYSGVTGPASFGSGFPMAPNSGTGIYFGVNGSGGTLLVPQGYVSGDTLPLSTSTYLGQSFASLGLTPGTYTYHVPHDTLTVEILPAATVPEPSTLALFGLLTLGGAVYCGWRRRKRHRTSCAPRATCPVV